MTRVLIAGVMRVTLASSFAILGIGFVSQNFNAFEEGGAKNGMGKLLVCRSDVP